MMNVRSMVVVVTLCLALFLALALLTEEAAAQKAKDKSDVGVSGDKKFATKTGVADSLGTKEFDKEKLPGKLKIGFAIGSVITAIAVMKYM